MPGKGVLVVWANLPDDAIDWYENEYLPDMHAQNSVHTLHCELTESGFEGDPIGQLDSPWPLCAVYEVEEIQKASDACYDKRNHPSDDMLAGPLAQARFDVRTYRELNRWQSEDWEFDASDVVSVTCMEWQVSPDMEDEVIYWYKNYMCPKISSSPDILRLRLFEINNATVLRGTSYETKEKDALHTYFSLVEFATEDYPWDAILELAENEQWKLYFDGESRVVTWQLSHYLVKRLYAEENKKRPETGSDISPKASAGDTSSKSA